MQILKEKNALETKIAEFKKKNFSIGFVPTMGALHEGHLSLIKAALASCDKVVVSIFVNPTQFDSQHDLEKYPRNLEDDVEKISKVNKDVLIFSPAASEIYGSEISSEDFSFDGLEHEMEGRYRKGHFNGVGTVVRKLFELVQPDKAFFGEKDFQQLQIIRKLVEKLQLQVEIIGCPIDREGHGLARSSRNERLSKEERQKAGFIYKILQEVRSEFGTKSLSEIRAHVLKEFNSNPSLKLEYFEIANVSTLKSVEEQRENEYYRAFIAAYAGETRLIDNVALN